MTEPWFLAPLVRCRAHGSRRRGHLLGGGNQREETEVSVFVVIDIGCYECGVTSEYVSAHATWEDAQAAADARDETTHRWRQDGQTMAQVFVVPEAFLPA